MAGSLASNIFIVTTCCCKFSKEIDRRLCDVNNETLRHSLDTGDMRRILGRSLENGTISFATQQRFAFFFFTDLTVIYILCQLKGRAGPWWLVTFGIQLTSL